ncbi:hypothetical protein PM082_022229 [Marasmius tenuissimus]|nr:hypothetical protein PM082_022229 [Marasmius tenuissimus]
MKLYLDQSRTEYCVSGRREARASAFLSHRTQKAKEQAIRDNLLWPNVTGEPYTFSSRIVGGSDPATPLFSLNQALIRDSNPDAEETNKLSAIRSTAIYLSCESPSPQYPNLIPV